MIRSGPLSDALASNEAFYTVQGDFDYRRAPLRYPLQLVDMVGAQELVWKRNILATNVIKIGLEGNVAFGRTEDWQFNHNAPIEQAFWFVVSVDDGKIQKFSSFSEWSEALGRSSVDSSIMLESTAIMQSFQDSQLLAFEKP